MTSTRYESVRTPAALFPRENVEFSGLLVQAAKRVFERIYTWQERVEQRQHLASLDERFQKDVGLSRADIDREVAKPFWRG